jgi:chromosome segregation ATPase
MSVTELQSKINPMSDQTGNVDARLRQAIIDKKEAQIKEWSEQIDQVQATLQNTADGVRSDAGQKIEELKSARDAARARLDELTQATRETWSDVLKQTDSVFQTMSDRFHEFVSNNS